jgi:hypothetical protein
MSLNKGKTKAKPAKKPAKKTTAATAGIPKRGVMNRRKYNEAISGDTMSNYAMYKAGGKVKKYQAGKQVADSTGIYAQKTREALSKMSPKNPGSEEAYDKAKQNQIDYENRKNMSNFKLPLTAPRSVNRAGGTTRKYKSGGSTFPDLTGDGKVTRADVLKGRGVFKKGGSAKKKK